MRVLILGGTGFVGGHLARACLAAGDAVTVTGRAARPIPGVQAVGCDVREEASVVSALELAAPDRVFHLAGHASPMRSIDSEAEVLRTNVVGTANVLRAVKRVAPHARVLYVGSADEYGRVPADHQPIREDEPLRPVSPYGVSRAGASLVAQRFALAEGLFVVRTRSFNHTGPGQTLEYAAPSFADQLARAAARGLVEAEVHTGDLSVRRDFSGVTAVVAAYRALLERGTSGEVYNVASGAAVSLREILDRIGAFAGVTPRVVTDPARVRPVDLPVLRGDPSRLLAVTGVSLAGSIDAALEALVREAQHRAREAASG